MNHSHQEESGRKESGRQESDRPTVLILFSTGWAIRNYLRSGVLSQLASQCHVVAALRYLDEAIVGELAAESVAAVPLPQLNWGVTTRNARKVLDRAYQYRHPNIPLGFRRQQVWRSRGAVGRLRLALLDGLAYSFSRVGFTQLNRTHAWLSARDLRLSAPEQLIESLRPDVIFSTTPHMQAELPILHAARVRNVSLATAILSWDNLSSKGLLPVTFDRYFVWNEIMASELRTLYPEVPPGNVMITGTPQFDFHQRRRAMTREAFCQAVQLDPARPIIIYTASTASQLLDEAWIVDRLQNAIASGRLPFRPQLLVRIHPLDQGNQFREIARQETRVVQAWPLDRRERMWSSPSEQDIDLLHATLTHAAVNVNFFSTMTLDFCVADRPVVNIAIPTPASLAQGMDPVGFYRYEYYRPVLQEGAARLARTMDELISIVTLYLQDPTLDRPQRARLTSLLCGQRDGKAGSRIAQSVIDLAKQGN